MISSSSIAKALTDKKGFKESSEKEIAQKLISFLKKNHLLGLLPRVIDRLERHSEKEKKHNTVFITTSHNFSESLMREIENKSGEIDNKIIERKVDGGLIGGFKVKNGYKVIDASLKTNLKVLKESLLKTNG